MRKGINIVIIIVLVKPHCNTNGRLNTTDNVSVFRSESVASTGNFGLIKAPDESNGNGSRRY